MGEPEFEALTPREREILALLCQRLSDREMAKQLVLGVNTVKWYNRQIFSKLGVKNRKQVIQRAAALGLYGGRKTERPAPKHNLPSALTPFVGRSIELAEVGRYLAHPHTRLLTILAPGGMGKTRLALEAAGNSLDRFADGAFFVAMAGLTAVDQFAPAVADALGFQFMPDGRTPQQQLADFLRRKQLLLVLDNFEHLLDAGPLVTALLSAAPQLTALVTSRERLHLTGESVYPLAGLQYPDAAADEPLRYGASALFVECALRANPHFDTDNTDGIVRLCRIAQGMPLAIELAAAWAATLTASEIASEVERSADFLRTTTMRDTPERLRSVRAVFEAAWARLDEDARRAFRWMSVFRGGCTREAAVTVAGASVTTLSLLVDKALLWRNVKTDRYEVHELLRQYAEAELDKAGETDAARKAHLDFYGPFAHKWSRSIQRGKQLESFAMLDADIDNIRHAIAYATTRGIADELGAFSELTALYDRHGWWAELREFTSAAIQRLEPHDSVALARMMQSKCVALFRLAVDFPLVYDLSKRSLEMLLRLDALGAPGAREALPRAYLDHDIGLWLTGRLNEGQKLLLAAEPLFEALNDPFDLPTINHHIGESAIWNNDFEMGEAREQKAVRLYAQAGNYWGMCHCLNTLAECAMRRGDYPAAEEYATQSLSLARMIEFDLGIDWSTSWMARLARAKRDWDAAYDTLLDVLRQRRRQGRPNHLLFPVLIDLAEAAAMLGNTAEAERWLRESVATFNVRANEHEFSQWLMIVTRCLIVRNDLGQAAVFFAYLQGRGGVTGFEFPHDRALHDELAHLCRDALSPAEFAAAVERGKTLTPEAAIAELSALL